MRLNERKQRGVEENKKMAYLIDLKTISISEFMQRFEYKFMRGENGVGYFYSINNLNFQSTHNKFILYFSSGFEQWYQFGTNLS